MEEETCWEEKERLSASDRIDVVTDAADEDGRLLALNSRCGKLEVAWDRCIRIAEFVGRGVDDCRRGASQRAREVGHFGCLSTQALAQGSRKLGKLQLGGSAAAGEGKVMRIRC
jgi:hypothetical protein